MGTLQKTRWTVPTPYDGLTLRQKIALDAIPVPEIFEFGHDRHGEGHRIVSGMMGHNTEIRIRWTVRGLKVDPMYYD